MVLINLSGLLWKALNKGLDLLVAATFGRGNKPAITPSAVLQKEPGLTPEDAQIVADLAKQEQSAADQINQLDPADVHDLDIVPVNQPYGLGKAEEERIEYGIEAHIYTESDPEGFPISFKLTSPYPLSLEEMLAFGQEEAKRRVSTSPQAFFAGAEEGEVQVGVVALNYVVRTW